MPDGSERAAIFIRVCPIAEAGECGEGGQGGKRIGSSASATWPETAGRVLFGSDSVEGGNCRQDGGAGLIGSGFFTREDVFADRLCHN